MSRTSTVRMALQTLHLQQAAGRLGQEAQLVVLLDSVAGGIAAAVAVLVVDRAAAVIAGLSRPFTFNEGCALAQPSSSW